MFVSMPRSWSAVGIKQIDANYWAKRCEIPVGTLEPYESYDIDNDGKRVIPMSEIVRIKFNPVGKNFTENTALTVLSLGGSGDGKGLIQKIAIAVLQAAGYRNICIDPLKFETGRAITKWSNSPRLPPNMEARGIPMHHFIPSSIIDNIPRLHHNFRKFTIYLSELTESEFLQGMGMTDTAASFVSRLITGRYNGDCIDFAGREIITFSELERALNILSSKENGYEEIPQASADNAMRVLAKLQDLKIVGDGRYRSLDPMNEWNADNSNKVITISYKTYPQRFLTFHVGFLIWKAGKYHINSDDKKPIMFFLDDAKEYADANIKFVDFNFAVDQINQIGFNYRGAGVYDWLSVQSLSIISQTVAETFNIKLISPYFKNPKSLRNINIPDKVIHWLETDVLVKDKERHLVQWVLVDPDNKVKVFFPFTPPCNHFKEIYFNREVVET